MHDCPKHQPRIQERINPIADCAFNFTRRPCNPVKKHVNLSFPHSNVWNNPSSTQNRKFWHRIQPENSTGSIPSANSTTSHPGPHHLMVFDDPPHSDPCICLSLPPPFAVLHFLASPSIRQQAPQTSHCSFRRVPDAFFSSSSFLLSSADSSLSNSGSSTHPLFHSSPRSGERYSTISEEIVFLHCVRVPPLILGNSMFVTSLCFFRHETNDHNRARFETHRLQRSNPATERSHAKQSGTPRQPETVPLLASLLARADCRRDVQTSKERSSPQCAHLRVQMHSRPTKTYHMKWEKRSGIASYQYFLRHFLTSVGHGTFNVARQTDNPTLCPHPLPHGKAHPSHSTPTERRRSLEGHRNRTPKCTKDRKVYQFVLTVFRDAGVVASHKQERITSAGASIAGDH